MLAICARLPTQEVLTTLTALFTGMRWGEVCGMGSRFLHLLGAPSGRARTERIGTGRYQVDATAGVRRAMTRRIAPLCPGIRFHDLRHSHKTLLTELGVPEVLQDERLGHHPPGMRTAYAHTTTEMRTTMLEGLERTWQHTTAHMPF